MSEIPFQHNLPLSQRPDSLTGPEQDVRHALAEYRGLYDGEGVTEEDFVATRDLWETYKAHIRDYPRPLRQELSLTEFGVALIAKFPHIEEMDEDFPKRRFYRAQHMVRGRRVRGYRGIRGPKSVKVRLERGRVSIQQSLERQADASD